MGDTPLSSLSLDELADIMGVLRLNTDYLEFFGLREKKVLGFDTSGCGTSVVLACSERYGGITRVVKKRMTKKEILERTNKNLVSVKKSFLTELAILKHFPTHPNIIGGVHGVVCPDYLAVTMNYCEYGNLTRIIPHIDCVLLCIISTALIHAVAHLHHHRIVHNDINPKTIMFYRGTSGIMPVLTGFSHAEQVPTGQNYVDRDYYPGTDRDYFPPEISRNAAFRSDLFKCDCFCVGLVLWCMAQRSYPPDTSGDYFTRAIQTARVNKWLKFFYNYCSKILQNGWGSVKPSDLSFQSGSNKTEYSGVYNSFNNSNTEPNNNSSQSGCSNTEYSVRQQQQHGAEQ